MAVCRLRMLPLTRSLKHCNNGRLQLSSSRHAWIWTGRRKYSSERMSYAEGSTSPPLINSTIPAHFDGIVEQYGDRTAVVSSHQQKRLTYGQLREKSHRVASGLWSAGVRKGDRVAVMMGNCLEYAIATYSLFRLGAILVPLNPAFTSAQVISALKHLTASHLIISSETNLSRRTPQSNLPLLKELIIDSSNSKLSFNQVPSLTQIIVADNSSSRVDLSILKAILPFPSLLSSSSLPSIPDLDPLETVNIQFTSGTTSSPKAACLTHHSILNNGASIGDRMLLTPSDIICCPPPLFHCFGSVLGYMASATHGSSIVFPSEAFDPLATLRAVQTEKCTALYGVPTMFASELDLLASGAVERKGFERLRTGIAAGSSVPASLMRKLHKELNLTELTICYGMTETSPVSAMTTTDDPLEKRVDSVGRLLPHIRAKVVDATDRTRVLPVGERGELAVSGYLVMKGYWDDEVRTKEAMETDEEGIVWMHTGDEATLDSQGYVRITGRLKDIIIRGGENIHPLEVENCILSHSSVSDVSVVGVKDERYGEVVCAFVIRRDGKTENGEEKEKDKDAEGIKHWVRERLSRHLVPKHIFFISQFPKTASGKVQKFALRDIGDGLIRELKLRESEIVKGDSSTRR